MSESRHVEDRPPVEGTAASAPLRNQRHRSHRDEPTREDIEDALRIWRGTRDTLSWPAQVAVAVADERDRLLGTMEKARLYFRLYDNDPDENGERLFAEPVGDDYWEAVEAAEVSLRADLAFDNPHLGADSASPGEAS